MDVKSVFLNELLDEDIYIEQTKGCTIAYEEDKVYMIKKTLYSLKLALTAWYSRLDTYLFSQCFIKSLDEPTLCFKSQADGMLIMI